MYCVSDMDYLKDFNMILNDYIIDCFLDESDKKETDDEIIINTNILINENKIFFSQNAPISQIQNDPSSQIQNNTISQIIKNKPISQMQNIKKLNKNKIHYNKLDNNESRFRDNVERNKIYKDLKNKRDQDTVRYTNNVKTR